MKEVEAIFFDSDGVILESIYVKGCAFGKLFGDYPEHVEEFSVPLISRAIGQNI